MGMLVSFSQKDGFATALEKTFDGKHPCKLCKAVDQARQDSCPGKALIKSDLKITWMLVEQTQLLWSPATEISFPSADLSSDLIFLVPSLPPPKSV